MKKVFKLLAICGAFFAVIFLIDKGVDLIRGTSGGSHSVANMQEYREHIDSLATLIGNGNRWDDEPFGAALVYCDQLQIPDAKKAQLRDYMCSKFIDAVRKAVESNYSQTMSRSNVLGNDNLETLRKGMTTMETELPQVTSSQKWAPIKEMFKLHDDIFNFTKEIEIRAQVNPKLEWSGNCPTLSRRRVYNFDALRTNRFSQQAALTSRLNSYPAMRRARWIADGLSDSTVNANINRAQSNYQSVEGWAVDNFFSDLMTNIRSHLPENTTLESNCAKQLDNQLTILRNELAGACISCTYVDRTLESYRRVHTQ